MSDWSQISGTISLPLSSRISLHKMIDVYFSGRKPIIEMKVRNNCKEFHIVVDIEITAIPLLGSLKEFCKALTEMSPSVRVSLQINSPFYFIKDKKCQAFA